MARRLPALLTAAAMLAACQATAVAPDVKRSPRASTEPRGGSPVPSASAPGASTAPVTSTAPAAIVGQALIKPTTPTATLRGTVAIDASYLVDAKAGSVLSNGGASLAAAGQGLLLSNNGGALVSNNAGSLIANNSGNIISDKGAGIISDKGAGIISDKGAGYALPLRFALAQAAAPAYGQTLPAAGMNLQVVGLTDGKPVSLGQDPDGKPVYGVYTNLAGGFEVYVPADLSGTVQVVAAVPDAADARLTYPLLARPERPDAGAIDEDTAAMTRYVRKGITDRFAGVLRAAREAKAAGATDDDTLVQGFFPNTEEVVPAEVLAFFGRLLGEIVAEAAKNPKIGADDDAALAARFADVVFARGLDPADIEFTIDAYSSAESRAEMQGAPHATGPALAVMTAILKDLRLAVVKAGAGKTPAEVEAFFAAKPYIQTANRLRPAGAAPYRIRKASDLADFISQEYAPLVRGQAYADDPMLTNHAIQELSKAVVADLGLPTTHVKALYAAGGSIALAMGPAAADPATKEIIFGIVRAWDQ